MAIIRRQRPYPQYNTYQEYKLHLRVDFKYKCIYCAVHENEWGGPRHFHVEHFKPKSAFPHLEVKYSNLLYSCDVCNTFKGDDWPGYLDPCKEDYRQHFRIEKKTGKIFGKSRNAKYMVVRLHLDRRQLQNLRRLRAQEEDIHKQIEKLVTSAFASIDQVIAKYNDPDTTQKLNIVKGAINAIYNHHLVYWKSRWTPIINEIDLR